MESDSASTRATSYWTASRAASRSRPERSAAMATARRLPIAEGDYAAQVLSAEELVAGQTQRDRDGQRQSGHQCGLDDRAPRCGDERSRHQQFHQHGSAADGQVDDGHDEEHSESEQEHDPLARKSPRVDPRAQCLPSILR